MRYIRTLAPWAVVLALIVILAACTQAASPTPSPSAPAAPSQSDAPSDEPSPSDAPSEAPTPVVIEHELPMIGRVTDDGIEVRTEPSLDAPILTGESFTDPGTMPEIVLDADDLVYVTLGPVFAEDESWYEVASVDGGDVNFAFGWVPGRYLEREDDSPAGFPVVVNVHGQGEGDSATADVIPGTPVSVRFAALPMPDADSCELDVTVIKTDGLGVNVATEALTELMIVEVTSNQLSSLFQEEAGTVTLEVETDCSFAATMTMPQS